MSLLMALSFTPKMTKKITMAFYLRFYRIKIALCHYFIDSLTLTLLDIELHFKNNLIRNLELSNKHANNFVSKNMFIFIEYMNKIYYLKRNHIITHLFLKITVFNQGER